MVILKSDTIRGIKPQFKQLFENQHTLNIGFKEVIKMKECGTITERDLIITKFLFKFNFATVDQIHDYLTILNPEMASNPEAIKNRLNKLVQYRVLNKFILVEDQEAKINEKGSYPEDSLEVYCMDVGGRYLLANYSNEEVADWYTVLTMKISELVQKELFVTQFYINLIRSSGDKVVFFNINPKMNVGRQSINPHFELCLNDNGKRAYYIGEVVLEIDMPGEFRGRAIKYESLLKTNGWKKYFHDIENAPPLLIVSESDYVALDASQMLHGMTEMDKFRATTIDRMEQPFYENGTFLKYENREGILQAVTLTKFKK